MAGTVWLGRLAQISARQPRPEPEAYGLEYVDIFYSHRVDENTPMEETAAALAHAVQSGKALYVGISSYSTARTQKMADLLREWKIPLLIHQPSYNLLNRWVDKTGLLETLKQNGTGCIAFTRWRRGC